MWFTAIRILIQEIQDNKGERKEMFKGIEMSPKEEENF